MAYNGGGRVGKEVKKKRPTMLRRCCSNLLVVKYSKRRPLGTVKEEK
jgi:hypothetical protein